jgi:MYXO-CTERM domain-containing protein
MKKLTYLIQVFVLGVCLSFSLPVLAQNEDRDDVRKERRDNDDRDRNDLRDEDDNEARDDEDNDDDSDYGWIGLLGLAGLAGLLRRPEKKVHHENVYRSTDTGRSNLGGHTDTNRTV